MDTIKFNKKNSVVVAHRGLSGLERENTNVAFVAAGQRSYFGVETDVYRTLDGKYVLHHDTSTKRTAIDDLTIFESTFDTLRSLVLTDIDGVTKRADLRIPTLEEYVRTCKRYDKVCVLEFKTVYPVEHIAEMVEIIQELAILEGMEDDAFSVTEEEIDHLVEAFSETFAALREVKKLAAMIEAKPNSRIIATNAKSDDDILAEFAKMFS